jgi:beta-lactamase class A
MVIDVKILLLCDRLPHEFRQQSEAWLIANTTGSKRLRSGFPPMWRTGDNGAMGNIAIAWPPNRAPILIAVYLAEATAFSAILNDTFSEVARLSPRPFDDISI